jgi:hypothetical protein
MGDYNAFTESGRCHQRVAETRFEGGADVISQNADRRVLASQRQVMQYLRSGDWNIVAKLPIAATAGALNRLADYGRIERRGGGSRSEIKFTPAGLAALQAPI